jgi:hypothetical protein
MVHAGGGAPRVALLVALFSQAPGVATLKSIGGLPAHVAGRFEDMGACQRSRSGDYFLFDRRTHTVWSVPASRDAAPREIVGVGVESGRLLRPTAFDLAADRTFVVADAPYGKRRVQFFFETGARIGGFALGESAAPDITLHGVVVNGVGSIEYTGQSILVSQPESGRLVTEYAVDGRFVRSFGELRPTGHEADRDVHLALNAGRIVVNPRGGFYYVFLGGTPLFRKFDTAGTLLFERHVQGTELDEYVKTRPTAWPKRSGNEIPIVMPAVRAADADASGNLWISLAVPFTYVYDPQGERRGAFQFAAAGVVSPTSLSFGQDGRLLVTPGCHAFDTKGSVPARNLAARGLRP